MVACLLLGGGTRVGFLSDALLELFALPCIAVLLWRVRDAHLSSSARVLVWGSFALISWPLLQLIPLPPSLWVALPGRDQVLTSLRLLGTDLPWRPVSLAPQQSWLAMLSLLAPFGVLLGTLQLSLRERRHLSVILLVVGMVSVAIGLLQVAQGPSSPLRFFEFTNPTEAVGFFANRNHFAALLYCLTLIAAAWMLERSKVIGAGPIADAAFRGRHHHSARAELPVPSWCWWRRKRSLVREPVSASPSSPYLAPLPSASLIAGVAAEWLRPGC